MGDLIRRREAVLLIISCVVAEPNSRPPPRFELLNVPRMEEHHRTPVATQEPVLYPDPRYTIARGKQRSSAERTHFSATPCVLRLISTSSHACGDKTQPDVSPVGNSTTSVPASPSFLRQSSCCPLALLLTGAPTLIDTL